MAGRVLVVDDVEVNAQLVRAVLDRDGHTVSVASSGEAALAAIAREAPDLILLDVLMPGLDGFETCRRLKADAFTRLIPVVLFTALRDTDDRIRGFEAGADDFLSKPFHAHELRARVRSLIRIKRYTDDLETAESVILSLALTVEARDPSTDGHCQRLAAYAYAVGARLGLGEEDLIALERGGFLHDIGKVGIPDSVLLKPGPLTDREYALMKSHTVIGERLCGELRSLSRVRAIVRSHHERLDGSGYPDGLSGDDIPLRAQIISVVDLYDALTTQRPYKQPWSVQDAWAEMREHVKHGWYREDLVETLIELSQSGQLPYPDAGDV
jgi:putative two-component system response regulator